MKSKQIENHVTDTLHGKAIDQLPISIILFLAVCCGLSVANVYYAQPLLDSLADSFHIHHSVVGGVITATQLGCAIALFFVVPLGDLVRRKQLIKIQLLFLVAVLMLVALSTNLPTLIIGMLGVGLFGTAMTQGLIAYAATLSQPCERERGRVVGIVQSGVVIGLLVARALAGVVTDFAGWRSVYVLSATLSVLMLFFIWRYLPETKHHFLKLNFLSLIKSMFYMLKNERILQIRGVIGLFMFAAFSIFWTALVLPLSSPAFQMSHTEIGAFGLVGVVGALAAAGVGGLTDKGLGQKATAVALICLLVSWGSIALMPFAIWALILGIILLDMAGQAIHVINQNMILSIDPEASGRLIGCYMLFYSVGSGLGAIASTSIYGFAGWNGVCLLGFCVSVLAFVFWLMSLPFHK